MSKKSVKTLALILVLILANVINSLFINPLSNNLFKTLTNEVTSQVVTNEEETPTTEEFGIDSSVDCSSTQAISVSQEEAKKIYDETTYFNHVDIRVNGTFTINDKSYNIKIQNVKLNVVDGTKTIINTSFKNNSESYEWRVMGVSVPKSAKVNLTFDILLDGEIVREGYTTTYEGEVAFIQAIVDCDMHWGLDFKISAAEIINIALPNVSYQWTGLPDGLATLPETVLGYNEGDIHTIETSYQTGKYVVDEANGKLYTFAGWTYWSNVSDSHATKNQLTNNTITVTADTIIYGEWTATDLEFQQSHIDISLSLINNEEHLPEELYFTVTDPNGNKEEISYSKFTNNKYSISIKTEGNYTIEQRNSSISGFELLSTKITTTLTTVSSDTNKITLTADLEYQLPTEEKMSTLIGEVNYTNEYEKKIGQTIHNYPDLEIATADSKNNKLLSNATYTLTSTDQTKEEIVSEPTDENGSTKITDIEPGTYTLTESVAPKNYYLNETKYTITVKLTTTSPEEEYNSKTDDYTLTYNYIIEISPNTSYDITTSKITIFNEQITGSISISVNFSNTSDITKENYPATNKMNVTITGTNGYNKIVTVDSTNNYQATVTDLPLGIYEVKEVLTTANVPGYSLTTSYNGSIISKDSIKIIITAESTANTVTITNTYTQKIEDVNVEASFSIKSLDDKGNPIAGTTFELYDLEEELVDSEVTDETGTATFTGFKTDEDYILKLTSAPSGYNIKPYSWNINISLKDAEPTLEYDKESDVFKRVYEWDLDIESDEFTEDTLTVVSKKADTTINTVPLTKKNDYTVIYIVITMIGVTGLTATIFMKKTKLSL